MHQATALVTLARITQDGICVSCRRVLVDNGRFINATAWGQPLEFVAAWPYNDIILVQGITMLGGMQLGWYALCICLVVSWYLCFHVMCVTWFTKEMAFM